MGVVTVGRAFVFFAVFAFQPGGGHSTGNPPTGAGLPLLPQFRVDSGYALSPFAYDMNLLHFSREHGVMTFARAGGPALPSEVPTLCDVQDMAPRRPVGTPVDALGSIGTASAFLRKEADRRAHARPFCRGQATALFRTSRSWRAMSNSRWSRFISACSGVSPAFP